MFPREVKVHHVHILPRVIESLRDTLEVIAVIAN